MSQISVRRATHDDLDCLVRMYQATQRWLAEKGSDQWATNTKEKVRNRITSSIARGECYVAVDGDTPVGMITVDGYADPEFWHPADKPDDALYLHRMVVDRSAAGKNVGRMLLDWAERIAASRGKPLLRLDAWRTNTALHAYYRGQGFDAVRVVDLSHRGSGALFERRVRDTPTSVVSR